MYYQDGYDYGADYGEGEGENMVVCAQMKQWGPDVYVSPLLMCPLHCCQRETTVECCDKEE